LFRRILVGDGAGQDGGTGDGIRNRQGHHLRAADLSNLCFGGGEHVAVEPVGGVPQVVLNHQLIVAPASDLENLEDDRGQDADYKPGDGQNH
jgi:hypothetical protein